MAIVEQERVAAPAPSREVTEADVLERAAYGYEEGLYEWRRGRFAEDANGNFLNYTDVVGGRRGHAYCMVGATVQAAVDFGGRSSGVNAYRLYGRGAWQDWNDAPGRTKQEVVARLREAAARARGE